MEKYSVCRLCLCKGDLLDIFSIENVLEFELKDTIEELIQCEVEREDGCPWLICLTCQAKLTEFRLFKRRCLECKLAFDIRFKGSNSNPPNVKMVFSNCQVVNQAICLLENPVTIGDNVQLEPTIPAVIHEGVQGAHSWLVASGNLYFKEPAPPEVDAKGGEEDYSGESVPDDRPAICSLIKVSKKKMDPGAMRIEEGPVGTESIGIDEVIGGMDVGEMPIDGELVVSESTAAGLAGNDVGVTEEQAMGEPQFNGAGCISWGDESESMETSEQMSVSCVKEEPLDDEGPGPNIAEGNGSVEASGTGALPSGEAVGPQDIKQESAVDWDEAQEVPSCNPLTGSTLTCIAAHCPNSKSPSGVDFVTFPQDPSRVREWLARAGRLDLVQLDPVEFSGWYQLCTDHFDPSMFTSSPDRSLVEGAMPTIFSHNMVIEPLTCSGVVDSTPSNADLSCHAAEPSVNKPPRTQPFNFTSHPQVEITGINGDDSMKQKQKIKGTSNSGDRSKCCFVPMCSSRSRFDPDKVFVGVPRNKRMRMKWLKAANSKADNFQGHAYCCQDHFEMEEDFFNYNQSKYFGVSFLKLKPDTVPRYFDCQLKRKRAHRPKPRETSLSIQRKKMINELLQGRSGGSSEIPSGCSSGSSEIPSGCSSGSSEVPSGIGIESSEAPSGIGRECLEAPSGISSESSEVPLSGWPIKCEELEEEKPAVCEETSIYAEDSNSCTQLSSHSPCPILPPQCEEESRDSSIQSVSSTSQPESVKESTIVVKKHTKAPRKQVFNLRAQPELVFFAGHSGDE